MGGGDADLTIALDACNQVASADVGLLSNFSDIFNYGNKGNREILMAVGFKELESQANYFCNMYSSPDPSYVDPYTNEIIGQYAGGVVWSMTELVRNQFSDDDARKEGTFMFVPWSSYHPPLLVKGRGTLNAGVRYYTSDVILYRYADVLLMQAEAKNALGQDPSQELNQIRERAYGANFEVHQFVNGSKETNDDAILKERLLELATEGKRWWDLRRFNKAFDLVPSLKSKEGQDYLLLFPIANSLLSLEPNVKQNPGYTAE